MPLYEFVCLDCDQVTNAICGSDIRPQKIKCEFCPDSDAEYRIAAPSMFKVTFDKNGRKGVKVDLGNGKQIHRSATRERWEHNAGNMTAEQYKKNGSEVNESVYTKRYAEVKKEEKAVVDRERKKLLANIPEAK